MSLLKANNSVIQELTYLAVSIISLMLGVGRHWDHFYALPLTGHAQHAHTSKDRWIRSISSCFYEFEEFIFSRVALFV